MGYTHYWRKPNGTDGMENALPVIKDILNRYRDVIQYECDDNIDPVCNEELIRFNGIGDEGHETFYFQSGKENFSFCKTARKHYDIVVCECLIVLNYFIKDLEVSSDGMCGCLSDQEKMSLPGDCVDNTDGTWADAIFNVKEKYGIEYSAVCSEIRDPYFDWDLKFVSDKNLSKKIHWVHA